MHVRPSLLWIDDAVSPNDPSVRLLNGEGFLVDTADTGAGGLALLLVRAYNGVILDLRLPDMSGLDVLDKMRHVRCGARVLVLTGYPDHDAAVSAIRLGAWDFKSKLLLLGNEWIDLVRALSGAEKRPVELNAGPAANRTSTAVTSEPLYELQTLIRTLDKDATSQQLTAIVVQHVSRWLCERSASLQVFCAGAQLVRLLTVFRDDVNGHHLVDLASHIIERALRLCGLPRHSDVAAVIEMFEAAGNCRTLLKEDAVCARIGASASHLGRRLHAQTGWGFCEWRRSSTIRDAARMLATSDERVDQTAYRLGYEHASQFAREFRRTFGLTPREFRRFLYLGPRAKR